MTPIGLYVRIRGSCGFKMAPYHTLTYWQCLTETTALGPLQTLPIPSVGITRLNLGWDVYRLEFYVQHVAYFGV